MASEIALRISSDSTFFDSMLELIPPAFYFPIEVNEDKWSSKFAKNKKEGAPKQTVKEMSKKGKKAKFNSNKTLVEIQQDKIALEKSNTENGNGNGIEEEREAEREDRRGRKDNFKEIQPAASLDELKERLQAKILKMRGKRKSPEEEEKVEGKEKANKKVDSNKRRKIVHEKKVNNNDNNNDNKSAEKPLPAPATAVVEAEKKTNLDFSKIKFDNNATKKKRGNVESLLEKAKEANERMKELEKNEEGKEVVKEAKWKTLMKRASGDKGDRDDIKLLKKALKRKEKKKQKSAAEWAERKNEVQEAKDARQKERNDNINKKKEEKAKRRPGFEGKAQEFLNKNEKSNK